MAQPARRHDAPAPRGAYAAGPARSSFAYTRGSAALDPARMRPEPRRERPSTRPDVRRRPQVRVVPGERPNAQAASATLVRVAKYAVVGVLVLLVIGIVRVGLVSATVGNEIGMSTVNSRIKDIKTSSADLEVKAASLTNPGAVKTKAMAMGLVAPEESTSVVLGDDVVQTDADGNLSLSGSLAVHSKSA